MDNMPNHPNDLPEPVSDGSDVPVPEPEGINLNLNKEDTPMEYEVRLRNNHIKPAVSDDGELFTVQLASGQKTYHISELKGVTALSSEGTAVDKLAAEIQQPKEDKMELYHFMVQYTTSDGEKVFIRNITNTFINDKEGESYFASVEKKAPVNNQFAVNTGNWLPRLLMERLRDRKFRLVVVSHNDLREMGGLKKRVNGYTFSWANASYAFFLKVYGETDFGLEALGLEVDFAVKSAKRLQEIPRFTSMSLYDEDDSRFMFVEADSMDIVNSMAERPEFVVACFRTPEGMDPKVFDGMNYITKSMVLASILEQPRSVIRDRAFRAVKTGTITRLNARLLCKMGLIKGDFIIVDTRAQLNGADLVYHEDNLKAELRTSGWNLYTAFVHDPCHVSTWNDQTTINNSVALPTRHQINDVKLMREGAAKIISSGEMPDWMDWSQTSHGDHGTIQLTTMSDELKRDHIRWQHAGLSINDSQNFMYLGINGHVKQMEVGFVREVGLYKKMFLPMSNAINAGVVTYSSLKLMGGFDLAESGDRVFFDGRFGMVIPDHRFVDAFDLHGTWDLDDKADFVKIEIWSSTSEAIANLVADGVIDEKFVDEIGTTSENAGSALLVVRSPNGPGEYSIEFLNGHIDDLPCGVTHNDLTVVDLADLPRGQGHLLSLVNKTGLPKSTLVFGGPMTRDQALYMVEAQTENPGIGAIANAMMVWVNTFGPSFPPNVSEVFGEMVDAVQQGFDREVFRAVDKERVSILNQLLDSLAPSHSVDVKLSILKMPRLFSDRIPSENLAEKRLTKLSKLYRTMHIELRDEMTKKTLETRSQSDLVNLVAKIPVGSDIAPWAERFFNDFTGVLRRIDSMFQIDEFDDPFSKITKNYSKKMELQQAVKFMVESLEAFEDDTDRHVLGLYKWITKPGLHRKAPYGRYDRIIFQSGGDTSRSVMDLLIDALRNYGVLNQ